MGGGSFDGEEKLLENGGGGGGERKTKRIMKTPFQLELLEKAYQLDNYPSDSVRAELSAKTELSDRQLQMWFCHRRLKDRKGEKKTKKGEAPPPATTSVGVAVAGTLPRPPPVGSVDDMLDDDLGNEHGSGSGSGSGSSPYGHMDPHRAYVGHPGGAVPRISGRGRYHEPSQSLIQYRAIAFVEAQLGEPLTEDSPALGIEFDPLPPGAFNAPIAITTTPQKTSGRTYEASSSKGRSRALHEYQFLPEQPTVRSESYERVSQSHYYSSPSSRLGNKTPPLSNGRSYIYGYEEVPVAYGGPNHIMLPTSEDYEAVARKSPYLNVGTESPLNTHLNSGSDSALVPPEMRVNLEEAAGSMERKRKFDEARVAKEMDAHEKKMRKDLERQDILRRKREEQIKKDMERQERERRKEEERLLREKQREEERYQREQRREMERMEKCMLKESARAEKMKQKEELRREKEAAKQKAANDRAVARRLAKESTELIEDERLELMEIAVSRNNLKTILSLNSETLQNLDSFKDMLGLFPPKSVQLKKPFAIQPWLDSEENVGNLLMVWRFLLTFADVLGLWPFTLDEFVQAFHDYDPRLLGEIYVALLRTIIKDTGLGVNQNNVVNPVGVHLQIVEGAYTWGFDIRSWQCNLSPLTWPEVLRQLALSAGFGPKLKNRNVVELCSREENEGNDCIDIISNLRNGAAVEKAVSIMRERGYSNGRRSRHKLTPGTVKFAAYHVLSLEGSDGLNILGVAEKIQKSGLRDLTTSKTPEASIAAALSRDTKLFERTAPSTYCVRSPYRKDPVDAEAILSAAREKIRVFKSGLVNEVEADVDGMEVDDAEKDEDSESDTAEDPEIDDLATVLTPDKDANTPYDMNTCVPKVGSDNGSESLSHIDDKTSNGVGTAYLESFKMHDNGCLVEESKDVDGICLSNNNSDHEDTDIDESCPGEAWVHGLMEGEFSNLSVEERLNALVALVGVATEGNTISDVLEERLEAATALKKQMWAEAQLDKRRLKEEYLMKTPYASLVPNKTESNMMTSAADNGHMLALDEKEAMGNPAQQQKLIIDSHNDNNLHADPHSEKNSTTPNFVSGVDNAASQQSAYATERCRAQLKSYIGHKAEELYVYRSLPLGEDRRRNRYWQFIASASCNDPGTGRLFVELRDGSWRLIDSEEDFDALLASLDVRGVRESHLHAMLRKIEFLFKECGRRKQLGTSTDQHNTFSVKAEAYEVPSNPENSAGTDSPSSTVYPTNSENPEPSSSFKIETGRNSIEIKSSLRRYKSFEEWPTNSENPEPSSSFKIETGRNSIEIKSSLRRYKSFEEWMWQECLNPSALRATKYGKKRCLELIRRCDSCRDIYFFEDNHCPMCHKTYNAFDTTFDFSEHVAQCQEYRADFEKSFRSLEYPPPRIRLLKAFLALVEVCIPPEALQPVWSDAYRKSWGMKLYMSSSAEDFLQVLTLLEGAIKRDFLSSQFQTTGDLLASGNTAGYVVNDPSYFGNITILPWIPQTTSAVALRLMELDSYISYLSDEKAKDKAPRHILKIPSKYTGVRNVQEDEFAGVSGEVQPEEASLIDKGNDLGAIPIGVTRAQGGRVRTRGGKSQKSRVDSRGGKPDSISVASNEKLDVLGGWSGGSIRGMRVHKRGRRSVRKRPKPIKKAPAVPTTGMRSLPKPIIFDKSPSGFSGRDEWNGEESRQMMNVNEPSFSDRSNYDDDNNGQASGDEYDDMAIDNYAAVYNSRPNSHAREYNGDDGEYNVDDGDEEDDHDEVGDEGYRDEDDGDVNGGEYEERYVDNGGYLNAELDEGNGDEDGMGDGDQHGNYESGSTDYSSDD